MARENQSAPSTKYVCQRCDGTGRIYGSICGACVDGLTPLPPISPEGEPTGSSTDRAEGAGEDDR